jgi:hypothetical protein
MSTPKNSFSQNVLRLAKEHGVSGFDLQLAATLTHTPKEDWPAYLQPMFGNDIYDTFCFYCIYFAG